MSLSATRSNPHAPSAQGWALRSVKLPVESSSPFFPCRTHCSAPFLTAVSLARPKSKGQSLRALPIKRTKAVTCGHVVFPTGKRRGLPQHLPVLLGSQDPSNRRSPSFGPPTCPACSLQVTSVPSRAQLSRFRPAIHRTCLLLQCSSFKSPSSS